MGDKKEELKRAGESNKKVIDERPGRGRRSMRSCLLILSAVYKNLQQILKFARSTGLASDTAQF